MWDSRRVVLITLSLRSPNWVLFSHWRFQSKHSLGEIFLQTYFVNCTLPADNFCQSFVTVHNPIWGWRTSWQHIANIGANGWWLGSSNICFPCFRISTCVPSHSFHVLSKLPFIFHVVVLCLLSTRWSAYILVGQPEEISVTRWDFENVIQKQFSFSILDLVSF